MEKVLPKLAHSDKTGFVNMRYIGQNIRFLNDIMNKQILRDCVEFFFWLISKKAFVIIEWSFILKILEVFKFGCNFKKWFSVI